MFRLTIAVLLCMVMSCREGEKWIKRYGYNPIRPASSLLQPGALLMKKHGSNTLTRLLCTQQESLGNGFEPSVTKTVTGKFRKQKSLGWFVNADFLQQAKANGSASDVEDVFVQVENARVVHITDVDIYRNVAYRSKACRMAVERRRAAGWDITMVKSALVADASFNVKFASDSNLEMSAKIAQVQQLSVALGGNAHSVTENAAHATGLVWGIKEDMFLAGISIAPEEAKSLSRNSRLFPSDFVVIDEDLTAPTPEPTPEVTPSPSPEPPDPDAEPEPDLTIDDAEDYADEPPSGEAEAEAEEQVEVRLPRSRPPSR